MCGMSKTLVAPSRPSPSAPGAHPVVLGVLPDSPLLSVIVPSFNQGAFIEETIESALAQDYRPIEIIIVDGASSDQTLEVLERYRGVDEVRWLSEPDSGVVEAVNKGFALARGQILAIQSSDDLYLPGAFQRAVDFLRAHPSVGLAFGDVVKVDAEGQELHRTAHPPYSLEGFLRKTFYIPQPTAFFRREMVEELGGWDERYFIADTELWLCMLFRTEVQKIDSLLGKYRLHDNQRDHQAARIVKDYRRMIAASPEIAALPPRLRRVAEAGAHLTAMRYNPSGSYLLQSLHLWRAIWCDPGQLVRFWRSPLIVPGYLSLKVLAARLKRGVSRSTR